MASIEWTNMGEVMAKMKAREEKLKAVPKAARQMGVLALNEIHPLTNKKTGNWDGTIHAEVTEISSFKWGLWVGSKGAFSGAGYNYGARQERLYHPIEIGWHKAWPRMVDLWRQAIHGESSNLVTMGDSGGASSDFGESMGSEFGMMGGF
jgi:hypothetical protein